MAKVNYANTKDNLNKAIEDGSPCICITDPELAKHVLTVKKASKAAITAALIGLGVGTAM